MKIKQSSKFLYLIGGFLSGFFLSLIGMTIEDLNHNILLTPALSEIEHFFTPIVIGILASLFSYYYWKIKNQKYQTIEQYTKNLQALLEINMAFTSTINLDAVLQIIIDRATHFTNLDSGAVYLHEEERLYLGATTPPLPHEFPEVLRNDLLSNHPHIQKIFANQTTYYFIGYK